MQAFRRYFLEEKENRCHTLNLEGESIQRQDHHQERFLQYSRSTQEKSNSNKIQLNRES